MLSALESILFAVGEDGITLIDLCNILDKDSEEVLMLINKLKEKYQKDKNCGLKLNLLGNLYKLSTKEENNKFLESLAVNTSNNLSNSALETLAIIAYNEPITRSEIDEIRGINSSQMLRNLISKDFVEIVGKSDLPGKPNQYGITNNFLDYFGLSTKEELPKLNIENIEVLDDEDLFKSTYKEKVGE